MNKELFGQFIAENRRKKGWTQQTLADRLYVTDKAVSKWERGLSYPDMTLIEPLAAALDLSVAELINCSVSEKEPMEIQMAPLIDMAGETRRRDRKRIWLAAIAVWVVLAVISTLIFLLVLPMERDVDCVQFTGKQIINDTAYVFVEKEGALLRLRCKDRAVYDAILLDEKCDYYDIVYRWNRLSYRGELESCSISAAIGSEMDLIGSAIGIDSLLGIDCVWKQCYYVYPDPYRDNKHLYALRFYYCGDGNDYDVGENTEETTLLLVRDCRNSAICDYDNDGIVELFVLTRYEQQPYLLYDLEDGQVVSRYVDQVPELVQEQLFANLF